MKNPVSVVVPHLPSREEFFRRYCLPSIEENDPGEIFIVGDPERRGAPWARNRGAEKASEKWIFFCDDDVILSKGIFEKMAAAAEISSSFGYAYCNYMGISISEYVHPNGKVFTHKAQPFDSRVLRTGNFISTMSLIRRSVFPGFDESLPRLQDWDLWLTLLKYEIYGVHVDETLFIQFFLDRGISHGQIPVEVTQKILDKHGIVL
jgi:glycosyltransferase involved in cell wall biosynthesis